MIHQPSIVVPLFLVVVIERSLNWQKSPTFRWGIFSYPIHFSFYLSGQISYSAGGILHSLSAFLNGESCGSQVEEFPLRISKIACPPEMLQLRDRVVLDLHPRHLLCSFPVADDNRPYCALRKIQHQLIAAPALPIYLPFID